MAPVVQTAQWLPDGINLLDVEPGLAEELSDAERVEARRQIVLPSVAVEAGPWRPHALNEDAQIHGHIRGLLVVEGSLTINVTLAGRTCTRLIAPGELMLLEGSDLGTLPVQWGWSVVEPARLAVFDDRLLLIGRRWPLLLGAILDRAAAQTRQALVQQAISQLPRVEHRLLALLWAIADRSGVVRPDGVWLHLPVTHDALAEMIGARRPTVSLGLRALVEDGLIRHENEGWVLTRTSALDLAVDGPSEDPAHADPVRRAD